MHFAASPVAFGEVSVKQRILSILNYKKPGFWISFLGVAAFFFVTVCLLTNPTKTEITSVTIQSPTIMGGTLVSTLGDYKAILENSSLSFYVNSISENKRIGYIEAYDDGDGTPESAETGIRIRGSWSGNGY
jgi:hypothetical protein